MKPLVRRERADRDVREVVEYYHDQQAADAAASFVDELERAYRHIQRHPATGSPRYAHELNLPGLRFWPLRRFPHLVFYVEGPNSIEVWRVLHGSRHIPGWLLEPDAP